MVGVSSTFPLTHDGRSQTRSFNPIQAHRSSRQLFPSRRIIRFCNEHRRGSYKSQIRLVIRWKRYVHLERHGLRGGKDFAGNGVSTDSRCFSVYWPWMYMQHFCENRGVVWEDHDFICKLLIILFDLPFFKLMFNCDEFNRSRITKKTLLNNQSNFEAEYLTCTSTFITKRKTELSVLFSFLLYS